MGDRTFAMLQHQELGVNVCYLLSQHLPTGKGQVFPPDQTKISLPFPCLGKKLWSCKLGSAHVGSSTIMSSLAAHLSRSPPCSCSPTSSH